MSAINTMTTPQCQGNVMSGVAPCSTMLARIWSAIESNWLRGHKKLKSVHVARGCTRRFVTISATALDILRRIALQRATKRSRYCQTQSYMNGHRQDAINTQRTAVGERLRAARRGTSAAHAVCAFTIIGIGAACNAQHTLPKRRQIRSRRGHEANRRTGRASAVDCRCQTRSSRDTSSPNRRCRQSIGGRRASPSSGSKHWSS